MRTLLLFLVIAPTLLAAPVPKERRQKADQQLIVGRWKQTFPQGSQSIWVFREDGQAHIEHGPMNVVKARFTLEPTTQPKKFNWTLTDNNSVFLGIYEITETKFAFAVSRSGASERPAEIQRNVPHGECYEFEKLTD